jgi:tetratricopeptide (TPR) repeat protein
MAIEHDPNDAVTFYCRGNLKSRLNDYDAAIAEYTKAIELNAGFALAYYDRGIQKYYKNEFEEAIKDFDKSIAIEPAAITYIGRGTLKLKVNDQAGALADYNKAIELEPDNALAYGNRAKYYQDMAEMEEEPVRKEELTQKAKDDEMKAKSLKR